MASFGRRLRHHHRRTRTRKLSFAAIAAICVASALVFSIVTGLLLRAFLDEETLLRLSKPKDTQKVEDPIETYLPAITATPVRLRDVTDSLPPIRSHSIRPAARCIIPLPSARIMSSRRHRIRIFTQR